MCHAGVPREEIARLVRFTPFSSSPTIRAVYRSAPPLPSLPPPPLPFESPFVRPSWALEINFPLCTPRAIVSAVKATAAARGGLAARAHARSSEFIPGIHHREIPSASPTAKLYATKSRLADFPSAGAASPPRCSRSRVLALRSSRPSHARRGCVPSPLTPTPSPPPQPARTSPGATWSF